MSKQEDKGKTSSYDQSDLLGMKPFRKIGVKDVVDKLKKKKSESLRADGDTSFDGEKSNVG